MATVWLVLWSLVMGLARCSNLTSAPADSELTLPPPSLLHRLYETTVALLDAPWTDMEAGSRQGTGTGGIRITLGAFAAVILATVFGVVGFGSVGLLAAKALSVGTLALFLTALTSLKHKHKGDSGGQTVHYVPVHSGSHHEHFHDRSELLPPYMDRNI